MTCYEEINNRYKEIEAKTLIEKAKEEKKKMLLIASPNLLILFIALKHLLS